MSVEDCYDDEAVVVGKYPRETTDDIVKIEGESVDYSKSLNASTYTAGWVLSSLRTNDQVYRNKFHSRKVKDITYYDISGGKGFISTILRCTVIFEDSVDEKDVYTTILKIPGFESINENNEKGDDLVDADKLTHRLTIFHEFECDFYTQLAPLLEIPAPKVFKTVSWTLNKQQGCIHMEDLTAKGKVMTFFDSLNLTQLRGIVKHVAHMHKQVLMIKDDDWKDKFLGNQTAFAKIMTMIDKTIVSFKKLIEDQYPTVIPLVEKYEKFCCNTEFSEYAFAQSYKDLNLTPVFVHGDMWTSNILMAIDENGDFTNQVAAFVDWQFVHRGSPMDDIARVFTICTDGNIRREAESYLLKYYLDTLSSELASEGLKAPYTLEELQEAYDYMFMAEAIHPLFMTIYLERTLKKEPHLETINKAKLDKVVLRTIHCLEDLDRLLSGKYKHVFDKYGK